MGDISHKADIHHETLAEIVLDTEAEVQGSGRQVGERTADGGLGREYELGSGQVGDSGVQHDRRQEVWRRGDRSNAGTRGAQRIDAERAAVEHTEAAANGGFAVSEDIVSKTDSGRNLHRRRFEVAIGGRDPGEGRAGIAGRIEGALLREGVLFAGHRVDGSLIGDRATAGGTYGYRAIGIEKLPLLGLGIGGPLEHAESLVYLIESAETLEARAIIERQAASDLPGVLEEELGLLVAGAVDLLDVVLAVTVHVAGERVRERVAGIDRVAEVRAEVIRSGGVVNGVDADVAGVMLEVETSLDAVAALDPGKVVTQGQQTVGTVERPAAVEAEAGEVGDSGGRGLSRKA